jgi:hypothetical protein
MSTVKGQRDPPGVELVGNWAELTSDLGRSVD